MGSREGEELPPQDIFPLESVAVFVGKEKMKSGSESLLRFWCEKVLVARVALAHEKVKVLQPDQFDEVWWHAVHDALTEVLRMFQIWACEQVTGVAGTNKIQARYTPNHDKRCPSCTSCIVYVNCEETFGHVLSCTEAGRVDLLMKSI